MDFERIVLIAGVLLVVIISQWRRRIGGILGLVMCGGILWWGLKAYDAGGAIGFAGKPLPRSYFFVFVAVFVLLNAFSVWRGDRKDQD